jgi:hypothetical protein
MRAATRKRTDEHKNEMAARAARREHRSARHLRMLAKRAEAKELARRLREVAATQAAED